MEEKGKNLLFNLGYSHPIEFDIPAGITASLVKEGREVFVKVEGIDRQLVGQVAAKIRELRAEWDPKLRESMDDIMARGR